MDGLFARGNGCDVPRNKCNEPVVKRLMVPNIILNVKIIVVMHIYFSNSFEGFKTCFLTSTRAANALLWHARVCELLLNIRLFDKTSIIAYGLENEKVKIA